MSETPSSTIRTRASVATQWKRSSVMSAYSTESVLGDVWPFIRGRRFVDASPMTGKRKLYNKKNKSKKSKKGGSSDTYYAKVGYGLAHGVLRLVHCIKVDGCTVWKDQDGVAITGEYRSFSTDRGTVRIYKGSQTQGVDSDWADGPAYRGLAWMAWDYIKLGTERTAEPAISVEGTFGDNDDDGLYSVGEVIQELHNSEYVGLGANASLCTVSDELLNNKLVSVKITSETTLQDVCDTLLPLDFAHARYEGRVLTLTRRFNAIDWDDADIPSITPDNCLEPSTIKPETPSEHVSAVDVRYTLVYDGDEGDDTEGEFNESATWRDAVSPECGAKPVTIQAEHIITEAKAAAFSAAKGNEQTLSKTTGSSVICQDTWALAKTAVGQPIKVYDEISKTTLRAWVASRVISAVENKIELEWDLDSTSSIHDSSTYGYETPTFDSYEPVNPRAVQIVELPRPLLTKTGVGILCARGSEVVNGFGIMASVDAGANFDYVDNSTTFAVYGTIKTAIGTSTGTLVIEGVSIDADALESVSSAQAEADTILAFVGTPPKHEILSIQTITQDGNGQLTLAILRGRLGTLQASHAVGEPVYMVQKSSLPIVEEPVAEPSPIVDTAANPSAGHAYLFRLPQRIIANVQASDDCADLTVNVAGEYNRPLPPVSVVSSSGVLFMGTDMPFTVTHNFWLSEGYPDVDFYEASALTVVPVVVSSLGRHVLSARSTGSSLVTITGAEMIAALSGHIGTDFSIEFFSKVSSRCSRTGTSVALKCPIIAGAFGVQVALNAGPIVRENAIKPSSLPIVASIVEGTRVRENAIKPSNPLAITAALGAGAEMRENTIKPASQLSIVATLNSGSVLRSSQIKMENPLAINIALNSSTMSGEAALPASSSIVFEMASDYGVTGASPISSWVSKTGSASFTPYNSANPILDTSNAVNGYAPARFTNDTMRSSAVLGMPVAANPRSIMCLVNPNAKTGRNYLWAYGTTQQLSVLLGDSYLSFEAWGSIYPSNTSATLSSYQLLTLTYDGTQVKLYKNSSLILTYIIALAATAETVFAIGGRQNYADGYATDASYLSLTGWNTCLSAAQIAEAITYFNTKYALTLS